MSQFQSVVRRRTREDLPRCVEILHDTQRIDAYPRRPPHDPESWLDPPELRGAWVAELDGDVVGHAAWFEEPTASCARLWAERSGADPAEAAVVSRLYVDPAARGHQLGTRLLNAVAEAARREGRQPVLVVDTAGEAAVALYERLGWRFLGATVAQWGPDTVTVRNYAGPPD